MSSFHPKKRSYHPAGTSAWISAGDTCVMAITATMTAQTAMMMNCARSVMTTLIMPPSRT